MNTAALEAEILSLRQQLSVFLEKEKALKDVSSLLSISSPEWDIASLSLSDIIDSKEIQSIMEDFYKLIKIPTAIIDTSGKVLVKVGWQNVCTYYHRVHPVTLANCIESDTELTSGIEENEFKLYKCKNGLWDLATPLVIGGLVKGNLFMGQFFFEEEPLDVDKFKQQANIYNFNTAKYISSLEEVPRLKHENLDNAKAFLLKIAQTISRLYFNNIVLGKTLNERDQLVASLKQSEERFKALFEESSAIMLLIDPVSGNILNANHAAESFYGWTLEEICSKKVHDITEEDLVGEIETNLPDSHSICKHILSNGNTCWVELNTSYINVAGKKVLFCIIHNITERKRYQDSLKESEQNIRAILDATQESVFMFNKNGIILAANNIGAQRLKKKPGELIGLSLYDLIPKELADKRYEKLTEVLHNNKPIEFEDERDGIVFKHNVVPVFEKENIEKIVVFSRDITERRSNERELLKLFSAVEQSPNSIVITDSAGIIEYVNPKFTSITGYTTEEVLGHTPSVLKSGATNPIVYKSLWKTITSGKEWRGSLKNKKKNGQFYWESVSISPIRNNSGNITHFVAVKEDITLKKKREEQLFRLNRTLRAIRNSGNAMMHAENETDYINRVCQIIVEDCGHTMVWIGFAENDKAKTITPVASAGFEEGYLQTLNLTWSDTERGRGPTGTAIRTGKVTYCNDLLNDPNFKPWRNEALKRGYASSVVLPLMQKGKTFGAISIYSGELDSISPDEIDLLGELADDLAYGITVIRLKLEHQVAEAELNKYRLHLQDIVQQRTFELAVANEILKEAQEVAHIGHWQITLSDGCLTWSDEVFKIFGTDKNSFGYDLDSFVKMIHPDDRPIVLKEYEDSVANKTFYNVEHRIIRPDGEVRIVHEQCTTHYDDNGTPIDSLGVVQDITEFKKVQKEIEMHKSNLEDLVRVRTEELAKANDQLKFEIQKEKQVELLLKESLAKEKELNELKSRFISTTSHEFRTPLTSVLSSMQLIQRYRKKWDDDRIEEQFIKVKTAVTNLTKLLDDILTISYAESGRISLNLQPVNIEELCSIIINEVKHKASDRHSFVYSFKATEKVFPLDQKLLRFILNNLLSNAFKYSPDGGKVKLEVTNTQTHIKISVSDQGIGIPEDEKSFLFTPFYRAHNTTNIEGTGLGLSIVKKSVELHRGSIFCKANKGKGTLFIVELPVINDIQENIHETL